MKALFKGIVQHAFYHKRNPSDVYIIGHSLIDFTGLEHSVLAGSDSIIIR